MRFMAAMALAFLFTFNTWAAGTVLINGKNIKTRDELHLAFAKGLNLPKFYGKNLDALYDVLSADSTGEDIIKIKNIGILSARIGHEYVQSLLQTIGDAAEENPRIILLLE